jgi:tetratricopeptide (TPR) repeat protein
VQLAGAANVRHEYPLARTYFIEARQLSMEIGDAAMHGRTLSNYGTSEMDAGNYATAIELYDTALPVCRAIHSLSLEGYVLINKADAQLQLGAADYALATALEACTIGRSTREPRLLGTAMHVVGRVELEKGDFMAAIAHVCEAVEMLRQARYEVLLTDGLATLADAYARAGRLDDAASTAAELEERVRASVEVQKSPERICWVLASVARASGDRANAFKWSERGKAICRKCLAELTNAEEVEAYRTRRYNRELIEWA